MIKRSIPEIMNDELMFEVVHNDVFSINNMNDKEVCESIIHDILMVTMLEKEDNVKIDFGQHHLFRWIKPHQHQRVFREMLNPEIQGLIESKNGQLRIKNIKEVLQAAMDYCGHWWNGFTPPAGEEGILCLNHEAFEETVEEAGGFDEFIQTVYDKIAPDLMDIEATVPGNRTLN